METDVAQKLGELIAEVRNGIRRQDDTNALLREHIKADELLATRIASLEITRATARGSLGGVRWLASVGFAIAVALGGERIAQLFMGWHV